MLLCEKNALLYAVADQFFSPFFKRVLLQNRIDLKSVIFVGNQIKIYGHVDVSIGGDHRLPSKDWTDHEEF